MPHYCLLLLESPLVPALPGAGMPLPRVALMALLVELVVEALMGMREGDEGRPGCRFGLELYRGSLESLGEDTLFLLMLESPMEALLMLLFTCTLLPGDFPGVGVGETILVLDRSLPSKSSTSRLGI